MHREEMRLLLSTDVHDPSFLVNFRFAQNALRTILYDEEGIKFTKSITASEVSKFILF